MIRTSIDVRTNGFALVDPETLKRFHGVIPEGSNLLEQYTTTDQGELVIASGALLPIFNIPSFKYDFVVRLNSERSLFEPFVWKSNGDYPLEIIENAYLIDVGLLSSWNPIDFQTLSPLDIGAGKYAVRVELFVTRHDDNTVEAAGYMVVFTKGNDLPKLTADMFENMTL